MSELNHIWLAPTCHEDGDGRLWCRDDVWGDDCGCGIEQHSAVRYVIASDYDRDVSALESTVFKWRENYYRADLERDELRAQVEAMRADAERYRWIRSRESECNVEIPLDDGSGYLLPGYHEHLDAAIDAALQETKP